MTEILPKARSQPGERRNDKQRRWKVSCEEKYQREGSMGPNEQKASESKRALSDEQTLSQVS